MNGIIFEIKRFAVHDGGGIRTTLFLKGCPLHCPWCQNPEGLKCERFIWNNPISCIMCSSCEKSCPENAISVNNRILFDDTLCTMCKKCVDVCPTGALKISGEIISSKDAAEIVSRDKVFYKNGGGITLSGGEVLFQWEFAKEVLTMCHDRGINTAIETSLYSHREILQQIFDVVDRFIVDIKIFDSKKHLDIIGVDNKRILDNYQYLVQKNAKILVRTPLIPGYTDDDNNIRSIANFLYSNDHNAAYELLNFNSLCRSKYNALGIPYPVAGEPLSQERIDELYAIIENTGLRKYKENRND